MKRLALIPLLLFFLFAGRVSAQNAAFNGWCTLGGTQSLSSGIPSSNYLLGVIPNCLVTVYLTGTTTKATIYKDASSTPLTNPFNANVIGKTGTGQWLFYAVINQGYDVVMSGGNAPNTFPSPVTLTGLEVGGGGGGGVIAYPPAGVACSTGSAWCTSYQVGTSASNLVQLNLSAQLPAVDGSLLTNLTAANITAGALANGMTGTTQSPGDNTTKLATDAFVLANSGTTYTGTSPIVVTGTVISCPSCSTSSTTFGGDLATVTGTTQKVIGLDTVPFCTGYSPGNGQFIEYTTGSSPNPCYTTATSSAGNISGGTSGYLAVFGSATTITSGIAVGNTGTDIPQLSGGLLNNSVVNWAAPGTIGSGTPNTGAFTTLSASSTVTLSGIEGAGTYCVQVSSSGVLSNTGAACGSGSGAVNSVTAGNATLTISPTTGAVVASLNLANANTWTALQTFGTDISIGGVTATGATGTGNVMFSASPTTTGTLTAAAITSTNVTDSALTNGDCVQAGLAGILTTTGSPCGSGGGGYTNVVASSTADTTVALINAKCTGGQTYWVSVPISIATGGTIGSGCNVMFVKGGVLTIASGQTVTFANPIKENDGPSEHFTGSGAVAFAPTQNWYLEWFGGADDGNLSANTGTDNTAAWAAGYAASTSGNLILQCGSYRFATTGPAITKSSIGITSTCLTDPMIFSSSASASPIVNVSGASTSSVIYPNKVGNFQVGRAVPPNASVIGVQIHFAWAGIFEHIEVEDSTIGFDIEYDAANGIGQISNNSVVNGYSGVAQGTGSYIGYNMNGSTTGFSTTVLSNNVVIFNTSVITTTSTYGMNITGVFQDLNNDFFQTSLANYGIYCSGCTQGQDDQITNATLDAGVHGIYFSGLSGNTVEIRGGWITGNTSGGSCIELVNTGGVSISDMKLYFGTTAPCIYDHNSSLTVLNANSIENNRFYGGVGLGTSSQAIKVSNKYFELIVGNNVNASGGLANTNPMIQFVNSSYSVVHSNLLWSGTGVGIGFDSTSNNNCCGNLNTTDGYTLSDAGSGNEQSVTISGTSCTVGGTCSPTAPITIVTTSTVTLGGTYNVGVAFNENATASQSVTATLPTPAAGKYFCIKNFNNGSAANTGVLTFIVANTGTQSIIYNGVAQSGGTISSGGAAGDFGCVLGVSSTQWDFTPSGGSW